MPPANSLLISSISSLVIILANLLASINLQFVYKYSNIIDRESQIIMNKSLLGSLVEEGMKLAGQIIEATAFRPKTGKTESEETAITENLPEITAQKEPETRPISYKEGDLDYRWECLVKHFGGASILLREAFERANDEGIGSGTAEKILEAMNEHSGAETDLEKMLPIPEAKPIAEKLLSGVRQFRAAAWKVELPKGQGTKEDIEAAQLWNNIMFQETVSAARKYPGTTCVNEGM